VAPEKLPPFRTPMSHPSTLSCAVALTLAAMGVQAAPPLPQELADLSAPIEASLRLPGTGVQILAVKDRVFYVGGPGRYVFTGPAWDLWHGVKLTSVSQAAELAGRVDLARLPLNAAALGAIERPGGQGAAADHHAAWIFIDPICPRCIALLKSVEDNQVPAHVVLLALGGKESRTAARRLLCAPSPDAAWRALIDQAWGDLPEPAEDCDTQPLVRALIAAQLLGIEQVPLLIAADGRLHGGVPDDLTAWLAGP